MTRFFFAFNILAALFWMIMAFLVYFDLVTMRPETNAMITCVAMFLITAMYLDKDTERLTKK